MACNIGVAIFVHMWCSTWQWSDLPLAILCTKYSICSIVWSSVRKGITRSILRLDWEVLGMARVDQKSLTRRPMRYPCRIIGANSMFLLLCALTLSFPLSAWDSSKVGFKHQMKVGVEVFSRACRASTWSVLLHVAFGAGDCSFGKLISSCCSVELMLAKNSSSGRIIASCVASTVVYMVRSRVVSTKSGVVIVLFVVRCTSGGLHLWSDAKVLREESSFLNLGFSFGQCWPSVPSSNIVHIDWASHYILVHIQPRHRLLVMGGLAYEAMWSSHARGGIFVV